MSTIKLPPRTPKGMGTDGWPLESTIQEEIMRAWSRLPWVQFWRNNTGRLTDRNGRLVTYGLCPGSSDLVGIVTLARPVYGNGGKVVGHALGGDSGIGRFFAYEVKRPGEEPTEDQRFFLEVVRAAGGAASFGTSVEHAVDFLERARRGE